MEILHVSVLWHECIQPTSHVYVYALLRILQWNKRYNPQGGAEVIIVIPEDCLFH